jgi:hypothetical protein
MEYSFLFISLTGFSFLKYDGCQPQFRIFLASLAKSSIAVVCDVSSNHKKYNKNKSNKNKIKQKIENELPKKTATRLF